MEAQQIHEALKAKFADAVTAFVPDAKSPFITLKREAFRDAMLFLRDDPALRFDMLLLVTGLDYPMHFVSAYHLASVEHCHNIAIKVELPRECPEIESVADIWPAADWHEREEYDLMGIVYKGHPNLRRILCPEDWEGHPLRKDYVQPDEYHGISNIRQIGDDYYPKPDEDSKAILQYKEPKPPAPAKPAAAPTAPQKPAGEAAPKPDSTTEN